MKKIIQLLVFFLFIAGNLWASVQITTGAYIQDENDITKGSVQELTVDREYRSTEKITGSFGIGWLTNLDQRIVLGVDVDSQNAVNDELLSFIELLKTAIENCEKEIKENFEVEDPYEVMNELNTRLETIESIKKELEEIKESSQEMIKTAVTGSEEEKQLKETIASCEQWIKEAEQMKDEMKETLTNAEESLSNLKYYKEKLEETNASKLESEQKIQMNKNRKERNKKVMFEGMESFYEECGLETITYVNEKGYPYLMYESEKNPGAVWQEEDGNMLCYFDKGYFILVDNYTQKVFDYYGFIIAVYDGYGNHIDYIRDENEKIKYIKSSFGESFAVEYENDFIKAVVNERDPSEKVTYFYEGNRLTGVRDTDGDFTSIGYNKFGLISAINKADGSTYSIVYDDKISKGEILATQLINEEGKAQRFKYDRKKKITAFIDRDGNKRVYHYDEKHRTTKEELYNAKGELIQTPAAEKEALDYYFDSASNSLEIKENNITVIRELFNSKGQIIRYVDCRNEKEIIHDFEYDKFGNTIKDIVKNNIREMKYDSRNRITSLKQNGKQILTYEYENNGKTVRMIYSNGLIIEREKNNRKDLVKIKLYDSKSQKTIQTEVEYDRSHVPLRVFKGNGKTKELVKTFKYTDEGWMLSSELYGKGGEKKSFEAAEKVKASFEDLWDIPDFSSENTVYSDLNGINELKEKLFQD